MKDNRFHTFTIFLLSFVLVSSVAAMISCGGSNTTSSNPDGTVNTFLSDPPVCSNFLHVYVTVTKVTANINADAGPNSSGWQTLVDLTGNPTQVDLLTLHPSDTNQDFCGTLFKLGQEVLPPGKYQQIRLYLLDNGTAATSSDLCKNNSGWNCVVTGTEQNPVYSELQLPSEVQTGIKIPSSQIPGGLTVTAGQSVDFNINFDSCASVVMQGNHKYRLKPVLHAGEVTTISNTISGKVVEGPGSPNPGTGVPDAVVLLEQSDGNTPATDRVVLEQLTNPDGTFVFCPVPVPPNNGTYDVVVAGSTVEGSTTPITTTYNPSVVLGVPVGGATGGIPLFAETTAGGSLVSTEPATITGQILTSDSSSGVAGNVQLSALQSVTNGGNTFNITVPMYQADSTPPDNVTGSQPPIYTTLTTTSGSGGCATGSADCVAYTVTVPASAVAVGTWDSNSGNNVTAPAGTNATGQATYTINGLADGSNGLLACTTPAGGSVNVGSVAATPGQTTSGVDIQLSGCSSPTP